MKVETMPLHKVAEFLDSRRRPITERDRVAGPFPYYGANGIQDMIDGYIFDEPLILLAEDGGHFGSRTKPIAYRISGKCWVNNHAHVLRPKLGVDIGYLHRVLAFYNVLPFISGSTRQKLTKEAAAGLQIPLPPLEEQKRIAAILDKADTIRRKRLEAIDLSDQFLRSVFLDMFGDPVTNPKGWEVKELGEVCHRITDGTHQPPPFSTSGIPFLFVQNIVNGYIDFDTKKYIDQNTYFELTKNTPIHQGDILYSTVGSYGIAVIVDSDTPFCFQRHIGHLKPNNNLIDSVFLKCQLNSQALKRQADIIARGVAQKTINLSEIRKLKIIVPAKKQQNRFVSLSMRMSQIAACQKEAHRDVLFKFDSLTHHVFECLV